MHYVNKSAKIIYSEYLLKGGNVQLRGYYGEGLYNIASPKTQNSILNVGI